MTENHRLNHTQIFSPGGLIAQHLPGYEFRPQQLQMADAVANALEANTHLVVEAGTGIGKSFAYLLPAIDVALDTKQVVVISTNTISLQEQLIKKDIPFLQKILPTPFKAVLAKGRSNYLSRRRLKNLLSYERGLFDTREEVNELKRIVDWVNTTSDGSKADLEKQPMPEIWGQAVSDRDNCMGQQCPTYDTCFYFKARNRMWNADLLIVNHHLLFSDLALRKASPLAAVLPDYNYLIIDEAQHLETVATHHASVEISNARVKRFLDSLYRPRGNTGLLIRFERTHMLGLVENAREQMDKLFDNILEWNNKQGARGWGGSTTQRVDQSNFVENRLDIPLKRLQDGLKEMQEGTHDENDQQEITAHLRRCSQIREDLDLMIRHTDPECVYWISTSRQRYATQITLNATPVNVSEELQENLFDQVDSVVMTSATLATNRNLNYFKQRVGLSDCTDLLVGSPFDYMNQVEIHIPDRMPDPRNDAAFSQALITQIKHYLKQTHGKAFVLFTSYRTMDEVYDEVQPYLEALGIDSFKQGGELSRSAMLDAFKYDTDSVLFGTASFWEGVDVQGDALSNVIITKLPFEVPTHPVVEARVKEIEKRGGNPFMELSLPEAIIRFKQGFGRLIRTKTDKGIVVILDPRITTKFYGKQFLNSLPQCKIVKNARAARR
jgi:ATP-dependent DNA helicase DinG